MKNTLVVALLIGLLVLAGQTQAVTDEELGKIEQAMPSAPVTKPAQPRTLLVFSLCKGFPHSSIPYWQSALEIMGRKTGAFKVVQSSDMSVFNPESLKAFDAICLNNTTKLTPDAAQQKAILDFIHSGKGIVGIHAATDNFDDWLEGAMMMGGVFKGHPWGAGGTWAIKIDDPDHPLMKPFAGKGFKVNDEIYRTLPPHYTRASQRVLMSLDMSDEATKNARGVTPEDMDTGISWIKRVGKGRLFYCSLGHNHHLTWTTPVLEHYLAGIQYAMGDLQADDTPVGAVSDAEIEKVRSLASQISKSDWDQGQAAVAEMQQIMRTVSGQPAAVKAVEAVLLDALKSEATGAAKDFYCRTLATIGTDASVDVLAPMLADEGTFNVALLALDGIPGEKAETSLLSALKSEQDARQTAALITALGKRQSGRAVAAIAEAAGKGNAVIGEAAVEALASIASTDAVTALSRIAASNNELRQRAQDGLLRCADAMNRSGGRQTAQRVYNMVLGEADAPLIRAGALIGLAAAGAPQAGEQVIAALKGSDPMLRRTAAKIIAQTEDAGLVRQGIGLAGQLSPDVQAQLVTALSENKLRLGREAAEMLAGSSEKTVRMAAFDALSVLGGEQSVLLLANAAASGQDRDERQAAQNALYAIAGKQADEKILAGIMEENVSEAAKIELIQATVQRQTADASGALLKAARSGNSKIASQAVRALQSVAGPADVEALAMLMVDYPGTNTENALAAAALKVEDTNKRASALIAAYRPTAGTEVKASLLRVMGKLGDQNTRKLIVNAFDSNDPVIRDAAFRAMTDWPGSDFAAEMKAVSQSDSDIKTQVMAYRAYVRMLGTDAAALIDAFAVAPRPEEKKAVIGALAGCGSEQALAFVQKLSEDADLKTEAEMCIIGICEKLKASNAQAAGAALRKLADSGSTNAVKRRASELLK